MKKAELEAYVRGQKGLILVGKISSKKLVPFINKKVRLEVEVMGE